MPRKSKETLTIGFFGKGEVDEKEVGALLEDYLSDKGEDITFVLPITKVHFTETMQAVVDFATSVDPPIPYEAVTDEVSAKARNLAKVLKGASKTHNVSRIGQKVVSILAAKPNATLVVIWDDEDEDLEAVCNRAVDADLVVRDLTTALEEVDFEEEDGDEPEAEEETEAEAGEVEPDDDGNDDDEAGDNDFEPYTREELESADLDDIKQIASDFGIEMKPRTRAATYVDAILEAQEKALSEDDGEEPEEKTEKKTKAKDAEEPAAAALDVDALVERIVEEIGIGGVDEALGALAEKVTQNQAAVEEWMADLGKRLDALHKAVDGGPKKATKDDDSDDDPAETKAAGKAPVRRRLRK